MCSLLLAVVVSGCEAEESIALAMKYTGGYVLDGVDLLRGNYPVDLGRMTEDIPEEQVIVRVGLEEPHAVQLEYDGQVEDVGELAYLLPDAPVKIMFFSTGKDYHVIGWIDNSVTGAIERVSMYSRESEATFKRSATNPVSRIFYHPIYPEDKWNDINSLKISTVESMFDTTNLGKNTSPVDVDFLPPVSFEKLKELAVQVKVP